MILNDQSCTDKENIVISLSYFWLAKSIMKKLDPLTSKKRIAHESAAFGLSATDAFISNYITKLFKKQELLLIHIMICSNC